MSQVSKYKQSFGLVAKVYKKYRGSYNVELYRALLSLRMRSKDTSLTILDLGCGVGNSTEPLLQMAKKMRLRVSVTGCDPDALMLKEARASAKKNKLPLSYVLGSAEKLPFKKGQFDLVVSGAAFHWFATKKAMKEIQRVLKSGGVYTVFWVQEVPGKNIYFGGELYKKYKWQGIPKHLRDPKKIKEIFASAHFQKVKTLKIPYRSTRSMEEMIGLIKTNSSYAILSPKDRAAFERGMRKEYAKAYGVRPSTLVQVINMCSGITP